MRIQDYAQLDAVALAQAVRSAEISAVEVVDAAIGAIEALDPRLNALVLRDFEGARRQAATTRRDAPLAGVPFLVKDIGVHVAGWPTTMSSRFYAGAAPRPDSEIVARWRRAGVILLGKTNTPEFADDFITEPAFRGITRNPWNPGVSVGGSSGGSAAAVASGMVPVAGASDVGGSIRVPAACCGLFGLKPSRGLNPLGPYYAEGGSGLNCEHVITRSVRDSAALLDATAGPEPGAPYRAHRAVDSYLASLSSPTRALRIALVEESPGRAPLDPGIAAALRETARRLEGHGHLVEPERLPEEVHAAAAGEELGVLWQMDVALAIDDRERELGREPAGEELEALARHIRDRMRSLGALDYLRARRAAHRVGLAMARHFEHYDLLLTPSTATPPPPVGSIVSDGPSFDYERWARTSYGFAPYSELFNVTGQPAASLPVALDAHGLPIGIQLVGRQDHDHEVLKVAAALEREIAWTERHPPLWAGRRLSQA
ncbi:MAG: amidase [Gammaproteobacteria bacterium]|nr:amidase [Gammaproteobacteria bacterium]